MHNRLKYAILAACLTAGISPLSHADADEHQDSVTLYTLSNAVQNQVYAFQVNSFGQTQLHKYNTGGKGTAAGLGNQGALALSSDQQYLFAVNAGSNELSVFRIIADKLQLLDHQVEPGHHPVSVTVSNDTVYVVNSGDDSIFGYRFDRETGSLQPLAKSHVKLVDTATGAAQIAFNTDGDTLVVTEKALNKIRSFVLDEQGLPLGPSQSINSPGSTPFGFMFGKHENFFVSEAGNGPNTSSITAYALAQNGAMQIIDAKVPTTQTAACWVANTPNGRLSFTANAGSNSISAFAIDQAGGLSLLNAAAATPTHPTDLIVNQQGNLLFSLNGNQTIGVYGVQANGALLNLNSITGLPAAATGLVIHENLKTGWSE